MSIKVLSQSNYLFGWNNNLILEPKVNPNNFRDMLVRWTAHCDKQVHCCAVVELWLQPVYS